MSYIDYLQLFGFYRVVARLTELRHEIAYKYCPTGVSLGVYHCDLVLAMPLYEVFRGEVTIPGVDTRDDRRNARS